MTAIAHSDEGSLEGQGSDAGDSQKTRAAIEHLKAKIDKTMDLIRREQNQKECESLVGGHRLSSQGKGTTRALQSSVLMRIMKGRGQGECTSLSAWF